MEKWLALNMPFSSAGAELPANVPSASHSLIYKKNGTAKAGQDGDGFQHDISVWQMLNHDWDLIVCVFLVLQKSACWNFAVLEQSPRFSGLSNHELKFVPESETLGAKTSSVHSWHCMNKISFHNKLSACLLTRNRFSNWESLLRRGEAWYHKNLDALIVCEISSV